MRLLFVEICKRGIWCVVGVTLSIHVAHYVTPRSGVPHHNLTTPPIERTPPIRHLGTCRSSLWAWALGNLHQRPVHGYENCNKFLNLPNCKNSDVSFFYVWLDLFSFIIVCCIHFFLLHQEPSWSWSCSSWMYYYLCNQCLSPLTLRARIPLRRGVLNESLCDKVCQWLATGRWFSLGTPVSSINKTDHHDIA
jgi:hypothetical protein